MEFALVQGGCTWDEVLSVLGFRGHEVFAPTLGGSQLFGGP